MSKLRCRTGLNASDTPVACPHCGSSGRHVTVRLLKHQLNPEHLASIKRNEDFYFCASANCEVVYFSAERRRLFKSDLRQPVTQKSSGRARPLCYCFGFTEGMVQDELAATGRCTIPIQIETEIKAGHCACEIRNPQGSCCLGNIAAVERALSATRS